MGRDHRQQHSQRGNISTPCLEKKIYTILSIAASYIGRFSKFFHFHLAGIPIKKLVVGVVIELPNCCFYNPGPVLSICLEMLSSDDGHLQRQIPTYDFSGLVKFVHLWQFPYALCVLALATTENTSIISSNNCSSPCLRHDIIDLFHYL